MQNETDLLRSNNTRSYNFEVYKCDDASDGSVECQPEVLQQVPRDVLNNSFCPITCIVYHFLSHVVFLPWTLNDCFHYKFWYYILGAKTVKGHSVALDKSISNSRFKP